ncbi:unnamed protein product [Adineta steineri]|uniref:Arrestin-like N-terminal domain-containing protein n=1 Tax=Adineta steineri TaxID=433720 RepID=A0A819XF58_9BILA|nr:unnamed protein product [Adineta steineri]CAF4135043.1 unnamed protein product [Adineta steineri]
MANIYHYQSPQPTVNYNPYQSPQPPTVSYSPMDYQSQQPTASYNPYQNPQPTVNYNSTGYQSPHSPTVNYNPIVYQSRLCPPKRKRNVLLTIIVIIGVFFAMAAFRRNSKDTNDNKAEDYLLICRFDNQNKTQYWSGDNVSGTIEFINNNYPEFKLRSLNITLVGMFVYTTSSKTGNKGLSKKTKHEVSFFEKDLIVQSINNENQFVLPLGNYTWSFSSRLDQPLPPSIEQFKTSTPSIRYFVRVKVVRPEWYKRDFYKEFRIIVRDNSSWPANVTRFEKQSESQRGVLARVKFAKTVVAAGNKLSFDVDLHNSQSASVRGISAILTQIWKIGQIKTERLELLDTELEKFISSSIENFHKTFELNVPETIPATFSSYLNSSSTRILLNIHYELTIKVDIDGIFVDINLEVPLVIINAIEKKTRQMLSSSNTQSLLLY